MEEASRSIAEPIKFRRIEFEAGSILLRKNGRSFDALNDIELSLALSMSAAGGFSFDYNAYTTPLPPTWTLMLIGLVGFGALFRQTARVI